MRICIVQPRINAVTESFIAAHAERLPGDVVVLYGRPVQMCGRPVLSQSVFARGLRKLRRIATGQPWGWEKTLSFLSAFRRCKPSVVLAEYGPTGVQVMEACQIAQLPLVVHFHGYDASKSEVLNNLGAQYRQMFQEAAAIVAVSRAMRSRLIDLGAPPEKLFWNPYGVDHKKFSGARPADVVPSFLAVGRFCEKKAPYLTLRAFAQVLEAFPRATLRMIGDGPLLDTCRKETQALGIGESVTFLGAQDHHVVMEEMRCARAFVQHSVEAPDGDCEGTPVAILEASASGLPVVATKHGGIPDVVLHEQTGLLVNECDVPGMATQMLRLVQQPELAASLGRAGRQRVQAHFSTDRSISRLWEILQGAATNALPTAKDIAI